MRAGDIRKRITIEQPAEAADGLGEMVQTWTVFAVVWAGLHPLIGNERIQAAQINANANIEITMRYMDGVNPKMRIRYGTRTIQILSARNVDERNREISILGMEQER